MNTYVGFGPVFNCESRVLILGSFPSVKSREIGFYYGNPQNRFWKTVCGYFGEAPSDTDEKRDFLLRHNIALWDVIASCNIVGSADSSIHSEVIADIPSLFQGSRIRAVLLNGSKAYSLFEKHFPGYLFCAKKLSSTSPANPRFSLEEWYKALDWAFSEGV